MADKPKLRLNPTPDLPPKPVYDDIPARPRTREQCLELGRRHARDRGDKLSPAQALRLAELVRPHWPRIRAAREARAENETA